MTGGDRSGSVHHIYTFRAAAVSGMNTVVIDDAREEGELSDDGEIVEISEVPTQSRMSQDKLSSSISVSSVSTVMSPVAVAVRTRPSTSGSSLPSSRARSKSRPQSRRQSGISSSMTLGRELEKTKVERARRADPVRSSKSKTKGKTQKLAAALRSKVAPNVGAVSNSSVSVQRNGSEKTVPSRMSTPVLLKPRDHALQEMPPPVSNSPVPSRTGYSRNRLMSFMPRFPVPPSRTLLTKKLQRKTPLKKVAESMQDQIRARSPEADVHDTDYIDLLLEYKHIKKQLESIEKKETAQKEAAEQLDLGSDADAAGAGTAALDVLDGEWCIVDEVGSDQESATPVGDNSQQSFTHEEEGEIASEEGEDDDELQLLELRAAALASAAQANKRFIEEEGGPSSQSPLSNNNGRGAQRPTGSRNKQAVGAKKRTSSRYNDLKEPSSKRWRPDGVRRQDSREKPARELSRPKASRLDKDQLRLRRIWTLDNHAEQTKRFLEIMGVKVDDVLPRSSRNQLPSSQARLQGTGLEDNYDEVEMEVSSVESTPADMEDVEAAGPNRALLQSIQPQFPELTSAFFQQQLVSPASLGLGSASSWHSTESIPGLDFIGPAPPLPPPLPDSEPPRPEEPCEPEEPAAEPEESAEEHKEPGTRNRDMAVGAVCASSTPPSTEGDEDLDGEEALLRAQLLEAVVQKRKAKLDAEVRPGRSSSPLSVHMAVTAEDNQQPKNEPPFRPRVLVPQHAPVVISLAEDSSDEENLPETLQSAAPGLLSTSLDLFLKEARKTVEAEEKKSKVLQHRNTSTPTESVAIESSASAEMRPSGKVDQNKPQIQKKASHQEAALAMTRRAGAKHEDSEEKAVQQAVKDLEADLMQQRKSLIIEEKSLQLVKIETLKEKTGLQDVERKAQKLREQLAAAERIRNYRKNSIATLNKKAHSLQVSVDGKRSKLLELEKGLLQAGRKAYGKQYNPRLVATGLPGQNLAITIANNPVLPHKKPNPSKKAPVKFPANKAKKHQTQAKPQIYAKHQVSSRSKRQVSSETLAREKHRLQELEKQLAAKIKQYKDSQTKEQKERRKASISSQRPVPESIKTEEKMVFGFGVDVETEMVMITPQRRRSLLGQSPTMKPQLTPSPSAQPSLMGEIAIENADAGTAFAKDDPAAVAAASLQMQTGTQVDMPGGATLERLRKLVRHNLGSSEVELQSLDQMSALVFAPSIQQLPLSCNPHVKQEVEDMGATPFQKTHQSLLLAFRSFRFSPYFRTKEKLALTSATFSHKIDPSKVLCRFDLMGKCNDEHCQWQHHEDMMLSKDELLQDLAAYDPSMAGIPPKAAPSQCGRLIKKYAESFRQQNSKISHDQQCLLLIGKINEHCKHMPPHTTFLEPRKWRPTPPEREIAPSSSGGTSGQDDSEKVQLDREAPAMRPRLDDDMVLTDQDVRYWMLGNQDVVDMESGVIDNPHDVHLWIKLAFKKLHEERKDATECFEAALAILARGLEANQDSADIWLNYLNLFSRRQDPGDLLALSQQALLYAPSYELFWKNLELSETFPQKNEVCSRIRAFLCSPQCAEQGDLRSHHLLEILLHQVALHVSTGRYKKAISVLQSPLKRKNDKESGLCRLLTIQDRVVAWLSYVSLVELGQLPPQLYDPADCRPGRIVSKDKIYLPWKAKSKISADKLRAMFREAIKTCVVDKQVSTTDLPALTMLYKNLVQMDLALEKERLAWMGMQSWKQCQKFLREHPSATELWLYLAEVEHRSGNHSSVKKLFEDSLAATPYSAKLYHGLAGYHLLQSNADTALQLLEKCAIQHFDVDVNDSQSCDPNILYCKLLGLPVPLSFRMPSMWPTITPSLIEEQLVYLWINYSLLLELQGDTDQATEAFETALCKLRSTSDVQEAWYWYLLQAYQRLLAAPANSEKSTLFQHLQSLVHRCLSTTPCKMPLLHLPGRHWLDYSFHNSVIDFYCSCLPVEELGAVYGTYIDMMPANVNLIKKACEHALQSEDATLVRGLCVTALCDNKMSLDLWKMYIGATYREGSYKEVGKLYRKATKNLPLLMPLWKDYALFALVHATEEEVRKIYQSCLRLDVNIFDYLQAVLQSK